MRTTDMDNSGPLLEITVAHYEQHLIPERRFEQGVWWAMTDCKSRGSQMTARYRVSGYQDQGGDK